MAKYNPNTREQIFKLKDGRTIFKTHNGFEYWVEDQKGVVHSVTEKYYAQVKKNKV